MNNRICKSDHCNEDISHLNWRLRYCSDDCRRRPNSCANCGAPIGLSGLLCKSCATSGPNNANYGKTTSPETRAKMRASALGRTNSPETRAKISASNKGKVLSAETRAKIGAASKGRKLSAEARAKISAGNKGRRHTAESRAKISKAHKGKKLSAETRAKISAEGFVILRH